MSEAFLSTDELRSLAALQGVEPQDADLEGVRDFLAVFLPAVRELSRLLPPAAATAAPPPLDPE